MKNALNLDRHEPPKEYEVEVEKTEEAEKPAEPSNVIEDEPEEEQKQEEAVPKHDDL